MVSTKEVDDFLLNFIPTWSYRDIESALEAYYETGKTIDQLAEDVQAFSTDCEIDLDKIDVCAVAYDSLHQEARSEIESATGTDISNDDPYSGVNVSGNYMCTTIDGTDESFKALSDLIETIPNRSKVVEWLYQQVKQS